MLPSVRLANPMGRPSGAVTFPNRKLKKGKDLGFSPTTGFCSSSREKGEVMQAKARGHALGSIGDEDAGFFGAGKMRVYPGSPRPARRAFPGLLRAGREKVHWSQPQKAVLVGAGLQPVPIFGQVRKPVLRAGSQGPSP
jgi:hypothetical protein